MRIKSVKLQNIRSHVSSTISFPQGSILLWGDIGAGKTTILLAIEFALFGIIKGELAPENLLRHGAMQGSVELTFAINNREHTIVRKLRRGKQGIAQEAGYLLEQGEKFDGTPIELKAKILDLLGYPQDLLTKSKSLIYRYTVFTPQEQMKRILTDQVEYRLDTLRKVFGMDRYQRVLENAEIVIRMMREQESVLALASAQVHEKQRKQVELRHTLAESEGICQKLEKQRSEIVQTLLHATTKLADAEQEMQVVVALRAQMAVAEATLREQEQAHARLHRDLTEGVAAQERVKTQLQALDAPLIPGDLAAVMQRAAEGERVLQELLAQQATQQAQRNAIEQELQQIQQRLQARELLLAEQRTLQTQRDLAIKEKETRNEVERVLQEIETAAVHNAAELQRHQIQSERATTMLGQITQLRECPTCLQEIRPDHRERIDHEQRILLATSTQHLTLLHQQQQQFDEQLRRTKAQLEHTRIAETKFAAVDARLKALNQVAEEQQQDRTRAQQMRQLLETPIPLPPAREREFALQADRKLILALQEQENRASQRRLLMQQQAELLQRQQTLQLTMGQCEERLARDRVEYEKLKGTMTQYSESPNLLQKAKQALAAAQHQHEQISVQGAAAMARKQELANQMQVLAQEIEKDQRAEQRYLHLRSLKHWLSESFCKVLQVMEKQVMVRVHQEFSQLFREWFSALMDEEMLSARLDDTFNPLIEQNGYDTDLECLSGGERTALALAYRLALNKVINALITSVHTRELIVLDEPTDGFSDQQLDRVREVLQQLNMQQVILVSHESKIESFVDHVIRIGKNGHESVVLSP